MLTLRHGSTALAAGFFILLFLLMLAYPSEAWEAALQGVSIWWDILFPALFPFFVIAELMLGFGIVHFFGTLLDPMMRPLFRVPGIGGFVMAMGFASGYPVGAKLTAQLWEQKLVTRDEGERLVAFTTSSDPIFLIGAVSVGFFHDVSLAVLLAAAHYGSSIVIGILMRFHGNSPSTPATGPNPIEGTAGPGLVWRAFAAMHQARIRDGRTFGIMLQEAVQSSLRLVMVIGGLVVFFCVILEIMSVTHLMIRLSDITALILTAPGIPRELSQAVINGVFEVTLGARSAAEAGAHLLLPHKVAIAAFILSWGGICVHAQIVSMLNRTNLRYGPFLAARAIHAVLATAFVYLLWTPLQPLRGYVQHVTLNLPLLIRAHPVTGTGTDGWTDGITLWHDVVWPWLYPSALVLPLLSLIGLLLAGALFLILRPLLRGLVRLFS